MFEILITLTMLLGLPPTLTLEDLEGVNVMDATLTSLLEASSPATVTLDCSGTWTAPFCVGTTYQKRSSAGQSTEISDFFGKSWGREVTAQREVDYPASSSFNSFTKSIFKKVI